MEIINNSETQNLNPIVPQKNIFKILFFVLLGLFLIVSLLIIFLLINIKKTIPQPQNQTTGNISIVPTPIVLSEKTNVIKILDIQMDLPEGWTVSSVSENTAKILTDNQIPLILKLETPTSVVEPEESTKTQYGEFYGLAGSGSSYVARLINGKNYFFTWSSANDPNTLFGEVRTKYNIYPQTIFNIIKSIKLINISSDLTQDWKTYTDKTLGFSLKYPNYVELIDSKENSYDIHKPIIQFNVRKISEIYNEPEMVNNVIKEKTDLENGLIGKNMTYIDSSNNSWNILKIDNSIYGRITSVFQLHEVCSFMMKRYLVFYSNEYRIDVFYDYYGSQPLVPEEYMTVRKDICYTDSKIWKDGGAKSFYDAISTNTLKNETLQNWFNDFDKIIKTIKF